MRRRIWIASVSFVVLLLAGSAPVWADFPGRVTGAMNLEPPDWGMYFRVWINFDIHQVDPSTGEAKGTIEARVHNPVFGTKRLWYQPKCVSFGEVDGHPSAVVVAEIVRREGWDEVPTAGDPGQYLKWQVIDGGTPGGNGDVWRLQYYDYDEFVEYWPVYPDGGCADFVPDETNYADHGNLVVHD